MVSLHVSANSTFFLQRPDRINCNGGVVYQHGINGTLTSSFADDTSTEFYLEGGQLYNFTVIAKNDGGGTSSAESKGGRSQELGKFNCW